MKFVQRSRNYALNESIDTTNEYVLCKKANSYLQMCVTITWIGNIMTDEKSWR